MPSTKDLQGRDAHDDSPLLIILDATSAANLDILEALGTAGFRTRAATYDLDASSLLSSTRPAAAILVDRGEGGLVFDALRSKANGLGIPLLVVLDDPNGPRGAADRLAMADDWVARKNVAEELPERVARLLQRRASAGKGTRSGLPADSQFFSLVVHDLRTPLNVIGLSLRMIGQAIPRGDEDLEEDLRFVEENFKQIERMLTQLSDYYRLFEVEGNLDGVEFSPRLMLDELLEARSSRAGFKTSVVRLDVEEGPAVVELDPSRARLALQYVLANASAAANGEPIRLSMRKEGGRLMTEVAVDIPAPSSVHSVALTPRTFERLCGFAAERRGMDLAIAAKVSELFGGSARLEVGPERGTKVVLDWPLRLRNARA